MEKRAAMKKYFQRFPKWAVWMIVLGLPLLAAFGLGVLFIALGIWGLISYSRKPSDAQMDAWIEEDLKGLESHGLGKTGTDASDLVGEPVSVTGFRFWDLPNDTFMGFRKGKDNVQRFTPLEVVVINFTANQLLAYKAALDLTTGNPLNESTDEYFYRDVVSVSTKTENITVTLPGVSIPVQAKSAETFTLTTSGGTQVQVKLSDPDVIKAMGGGTIPKTRTERAIQTVRKMLREKKGSAAPA